MATTNTWDQVVQKITGVVNRGAFSKTFNPTTSQQNASGQDGYYTSVSIVCNAVSLSGNAGTGQVLSGYTFYNNSLTRQTGTMANRGALNWAPSGSSTYSVPAGYYSGGTLNSGTAYNNGYNAGNSAGQSAARGRYKTITSASISKQKFTFVSNSQSSRYSATFNPGLSVNPYACVCWFYCSNRTAKTIYISTGAYFYCATTETGDATDVIRYTGLASLGATSCCIPSACETSVPTSIRAYVYY